jgi:mono/diheme cytochrome c family protein
VSGIVMALLASNVGAQESLDRGKTSAQLFASHCSVCHKSPRGLAKSGGLFGLDGPARALYEQL